MHTQSNYKTVSVSASVTAVNGVQKRVRHKYFCHNLRSMALAYSDSMINSGLYDVTSLRTESVLEEFTPLPCKLTDILPYNLLYSSFIGQDEGLLDILNINMFYGHLAYPMSLLYALQKLPERRLGPDYHPLEVLPSLNIHVINSTPLFDSKPWELFVHRLPKLKRLNVTYVLQKGVSGMALKPNLHS